MIDRKIFRLAAGRRFQIQAVNRSSGAVEVLAPNLSEAQVRDWEPSRADRQSHKFFRVAYAKS